MVDILDSKLIYDFDLIFGKWIITMHYSLLIMVTRKISINVETKSMEETLLRNKLYCFCFLICRQGGSVHSRDRLKISSVIITTGRGL